MSESSKPRIRAQLAELEKLLRAGMLGCGVLGGFAVVSSILRWAMVARSIGFEGLFATLFYEFSVGEVYQGSQVVVFEHVHFAFHRLVFGATLCVVSAYLAWVSRRVRLRLSGVL